MAAPGPKPNATPEQDAAYRAEVAQYRQRVESVRAALRIMAYGHQEEPHLPDPHRGTCNCITVPLGGFGRTEVAAAWQEFASEGEPLPGAVGLPPEPVCMDGACPGHGEHPAAEHGARGRGA